MFMLCPTGAMNSVFSLLPAALLYPSYRSLLTVFFFFVAAILCTTYTAIARVIMNFIENNKKLS